MAPIGTGPLPAWPYHSEAFYKAEVEAVFRRSWLHVGRLSELPRPGDFIVRPIEVLKASVLIVHGKDGVIRAFHNVCMHRGMWLVEETAGNAPLFRCRYHMWTYETDGRLRGVPDAANFFDLDKDTCNLVPVALETCAGFIFVNLDEHRSTSLKDFLGEWHARLEDLPVGDGGIFSEYTYEVEANWKTTYDNFQEIYHGRSVHEKSIGTRNMVPENPFGYPTRYTVEPGSRHRSKTLWFNQDYQPDPVEAQALAINRAHMATLPVTPGAGSTEHFYIYPNLTLLSVRSNTFTQTIWPLGPERSRGVVRQYWPDADSKASLRFAREWQLASLLDIHSEDRDIIESAHAGLRSGAAKVVHFQVHEAMLRHSHLAVVDAVRSYLRTQGRDLEDLAHD